MTESNPPVTPEPTQFEKMTVLATRVMSVPKSEVDRREDEWRGQRKAAKKAKELLKDPESPQ